MGVMNTDINQGWWDKFSKEHPELSLCTGEALAYWQGIATNKGIIYHSFDMLEDILKKNGLLDRLSQIKFQC